MKFEFAKSLSGHDKDQTYLILRQDGQFAYLANGTERTVEKPKKKNSKHYQVIRHVPDDILKQLNETSPLTDEIIRRAVRAYDQSISRRQ